MYKRFKNIVWLLILIIYSVGSNAQKDITQFLGIPIDGYKPEMIQKLKSKGFTINQDSKDILEGEFNGTDVNLFIGTNNNKVWRIAVVDANPTNEANIRIRFNNLIQQFVDNSRYSTEADSTIAKFMIPKDEDISYEISVNNKRYQATFYQKTVKHDSLINERDILFAKDSLSDKDWERVGELVGEIITDVYDKFNKQVWFMINEAYGGYRIVIYYENKYNEAKGKDL